MSNYFGKIIVLIFLVLGMSSTFALLTVVAKAVSRSELKPCTVSFTIQGDQFEAFRGVDIEKQKNSIANALHTIVVESMVGCINDRLNQTTTL